MLAIALFVLAQAATPPPLNEVRDVVIRGLDGFDKNVDELNGFITSKFAADSDAPKTGLAVSSPDEVDAQGFHPLIVETVIIGSPADRAGVRTGDRIIRIGRRRIEHESADVFRALTEDIAGPLEVGLRRGTEELTVTVNRGPITCLQRASARIDQKKWAGLIAELRHLSSMVRSELDDESTPKLERYKAAHGQVAQLYGLFQEVGGLLSAELLDATGKECRFRSAPESK